MSHASAGSGSSSGLGWKLEKGNRTGCRSKIGERICEEVWNDLLTVAIHESVPWANEVCLSGVDLFSTSLV